MVIFYKLTKIQIQDLLVHSNCICIIKIQKIQNSLSAALLQKQKFCHACYSYAMDQFKYMLIKQLRANGRARCLERQK